MGLLLKVLANNILPVEILAHLLILLHGFAYLLLLLAATKRTILQSFLQLLERWEGNVQGIAFDIFGTQQAQAVGQIQLPVYFYYRAVFVHVGVLLLAGYPVGVGGRGLLVLFNVFSICVDGHLKNRDFIFAHHPGNLLSSEPIIILIAGVGQCDKVVHIVINPLFIHKIKIFIRTLVRSWLTSCVGNKAFEFVRQVPGKMEDDCRAATA